MTFPVPKHLYRWRFVETSLAHIGYYRLDYSHHLSAFFFRLKMPHSWCTARRWQVRLPARLIVCQTSSSACFVWQLCLLLLVLTDKVSTAHEQPCTSPALSQGYCEFTDVEFDVGRHLIHVQSDASNATPCLGQGSGWTLLPRKTDNGVSSLDCCDQVFEEGHFFKFQRGTETSSFFERTLLPLFGVVRRLSASKCAEVALLPGIEQDAVSVLYIFAHSV